MEQVKKTRRKQQRPKRRVITHDIGEWSWNHDNLKSKIVEADSELSCYGWTGSTGPETHLFGAFKNGRTQMTQARRLYWQGEYNEDIRTKRITMTCGNTHCMNIKHMKLAPNLKLFKDDGVTPAIPRTNTDVEEKTSKVKLELVKQYDEDLEKW